MSFKSFTNDNMRIIPLLEEVGLKNAIFARRIEDGGIYFGLDIRNVDDRLKQIIMGMDQEVSNILETFIMAKVFATGPKIFEVDQLDFTMLTETDINVSMEDYSQPFDTMIVQLPDQFCRNRVAMLPQGGQIHCGETWPESHEPDFVVLHCEIGFIAVAVVFKTGISLKLTIMGGPTIEDSLGVTGKMFKDSMECSPEELQVSEDAARGAMNYAMLLMEQGVRRIGNAQEGRLAGYVEKAKRRGRGVEIAERELRRLPIAYTIDRRVKLYRTVSDRRELPGQPTGRRVAPHHRRGYYKMQPHGPNNSLRKRLRIAPVFVNSDLFLGRMSETTTTYA